ncbi:MAG: tetratricopeptide repeat protein [Candidatus Competibacterales bacterium]|nr:tetratricopeptide repeat protein [Candidatus Competibacterales bacterium]
MPPPLYNPNPAPVVDRSVYRQGQRPAVPPAPPPPRSQVETTALERPEPIVAESDTPEPESTPASAATPADEAAPAPAAPQGNQAVVALLDSAANHVGAGQMDQAAAALERALRIEPRNATIWHDLGQIRLHQRDFDQAENMFEKSNGLAGSDRALKARNWRMIAIARRAAGNTAGAEAAEAQATVLER